MGSYLNMPPGFGFHVTDPETGEGRDIVFDTPSVDTVEITPEDEWFMNAALGVDSWRLDRWGSGYEISRYRKLGLSLEIPLLDEEDTNADFVANYIEQELAKALSSARRAASNVQVHSIESVQDLTPHQSLPPFPQPTIEDLNR